MRRYSGLLFIVLFIFMSISGIARQVRAIPFQYELSQYDVSDIVQDDLGYLWIGTYDGLNRFNGVENRIYRLRPDDETSLSHNRIRTLCYDSVSSLLYIGTDGGGISVYDYGTDSFFHIKLAMDDNPQLSGNDILDIVQGEEGSVWVSTRDAIFHIRYIPETGKLDIFDAIIIQGNDVANSILFADSRLMAVSNNSGRIRFFEPAGDDYAMTETVRFPEQVSISDVCYDFFMKRYWFSTSDGLFYLENGRLVKLIDSVSGMESITLDWEGKLYFYERNSGLCYFNPHDGTVSLLDMNNSEAVNIRKMYVDKTGVLWLCTPDAGLLSIDLYQKNFVKLDLENDMLVTRLYADDEGCLWIGTQRNGLVIYNLMSGRVIFQSMGGLVSCITELSDRNIYVVISGLIYKVEKQKPDNYRLTDVHVVNSGDFPDYGRIFSVCEDNSGYRWLGCRLGIVRTDKDWNMQYVYPLEMQNQVRVFGDIGRDAVWVCTQKRGMLEFDLGPDGNVDTVRTYANIPGNQSSLGSNTVWNMTQVVKDSIYVCTDAGLNILCPGTGTVSRFPETHYLSDVKALSVTEDNSGILWINTTHGIVSLDPQTSTMVKFGTSDGLTCGYMTEASCITRDNIMFVGGNKGISRFDPSDMFTESPEGNIFFTELYLAGRPVYVNREYDNRILLSEPLFDSEKITLKYNQNNFTVGLNTMSFRDSDKVRFQYRLAANDRTDWINSTPYTNLISFNDVKPGKYQLQARPVNATGSPSGQVTSLDIRIMRPFWSSAAAYMFYIISIAAIFVLIYRYYVKQYNLKKELLIEKITHQAEHEADENKVRFMVNITHELRTPLALIAAPLKELENEDLGYKSRELVTVMQRNVDRLLSLVNQFLDIRKLELGKMPLRLQNTSLSLLLRDCYRRFLPGADSKHVDFRLDLYPEEICGVTDIDKFVTVVTNLLSNAFKFTDEGGRIILSLYRNGRNVIVEVADNGCGIKDEDVPHVFDRFYQSSDGTASGSGIGLDLAKRYVDLMSGRISVTTEYGKGSVFRVELPIDKPSAVSGSIIRNAEESGTACETEDGSDLILKSGDSGNGKRILVADDDSDMLQYLSSLLSDKYTVDVASDGLSGYNKCVETIPDLVISDVMMPGMDGLELCSRIKRDFRTSHIPVILLTAKDESISGFESGAVDYITKPFDPGILRMKVDNMLRYMKDMAFDNGSVSTISEKIAQFKAEKEKEFLAKAYNIVIGNIDDSEFDIDKLVNELGTSRTQLHRKMTALTGASASTFIRNIRLDKAREMLLTGHYTITQVLYSVGFNSPSYFSKMYKERFGILPSELMK